VELAAGQMSEMQDTISLQPGFFTWVDGTPMHFFAVFDGHGGSHVSPPAPSKREGSSSCLVSICCYLLVSSLIILFLWLAPWFAPGRWRVSDLLLALLLSSSQVDRQLFLLWL
jgi:hypothetical protein